MTANIDDKEQLKIKELFNLNPYPSIVNEGYASSIDNKELSFYQSFNLTHPFYLKTKKFCNTKGKDILDVACGSGETTFALAQANPESNVIGIDFSEYSLQVAQSKLRSYKGNSNIEFIVADMTKLEKLKKEFDYITCLDALYLLNEPVQGLKSMKNVLKENGIIRTNLHCKHQRHEYYRIQELFRTIGLLKGIPKQTEIRKAKELLELLKDESIIKKRIWNDNLKSKEDEKQLLLMNHLFFGDKGSDLKEVKGFLKESGLEFLEMINSAEWDIDDLFYERPECLEEFLETATLPEKYYLYELLNPNHRLIDFWCINANETNHYNPNEEETTEEEWKNKKIYLLEYSKKESFFQALKSHIVHNEPYEITRNEFITPDIIGICLLPLWEEPLSIGRMVENYKKIKPYDYLTHKPSTEYDLFFTVKNAIQQLALTGHIIIEDSEC